jgi:hypothetical protein
MSTLRHFCWIAVALGTLAAQADAQMPKTKSVEGTRVAIDAPANGATVSSPFTVKFGLKGMGIAPAGVNHPNTGHHHLLIDMEKLPDFNAALPATDNIRHFGGGQTEVELTLAPGRHTLQMVFADYLHIPHDRPVVSEKITITVK